MIEPRPTSLIRPLRAVPDELDPNQLIIEGFEPDPPSSPTITNDHVIHVAESAPDWACDECLAEIQAAVRSGTLAVFVPRQSR